MPPDPNQDGWAEWSMYVLKELERLNRRDEMRARQIHELEKQMVAVQIRAGIWGAVGAALPIIAAFLSSRF